MGLVFGDIGFLVGTLSGVALGVIQHTAGDRDFSSSGLYDSLIDLGACQVGATALMYWAGRICDVGRHRTDGSKQGFYQSR